MVVRAKWAPKSENRMVVRAKRAPKFVFNFSKESNGNKFNNVTWCYYDTQHKSTCSSKQCQIGRVFRSKISEKQQHWLITVVITEKASERSEPRWVSTLAVISWTFWNVRNFWVRIVSSLWLLPLNSQTSKGTNHLTASSVLPCNEYPNLSDWALVIIVGSFSSYFNPPR